MNRFEKIFSNLMLVQLTLIVMFVILEVASRMINPDASPWARKLSYDATKHPAPYVMFKGGENEGPHGYRDQAPFKDDRYFKIVILGGSTVHNGEIALPLRLEAILRKEVGDKIRVYNYGYPSSKSGEELARLVYEVIDINPDMVIAYNGANDIAEPNGDPRPGYPFNFIAIEENPLFKSLEDYPTFSLLMYGSNFFRTILAPYFISKFTKYDELFEKHNKDRDLTNGLITEIYMNNVKKMSKVADSYGFPFYFIFQPQRLFALYEQIEDKKVFERGVPYIQSLYMRDILRKEYFPVMKNEMNLIDASDMMNDMPADEVFLDWCHVTEEARVIIVRRLADYLKSDVKKYYSKWSNR